MSDNSPKNKHNKYPAPFCMRFTEDERKTLELAAGNRPLAAYIRFLIFGKDLPPARMRGKKPVKDHQELAKLLSALGKSRLSQNINQLAKAANSGSLPVNMDVLQALNEATNSIQWIRQTLIKALGLKPADRTEDHDPESQ